MPLAHRLLAACAVALAVAASGCTYHNEILDPRGMALSEQPGARTVGHLRTTTHGLNLFAVWPIAPSLDAMELQYTYDRMTQQAATRGASKLIDLRSDRTIIPILPPILWYYSITLSGNMLE